MDWVVSAGELPGSRSSEEQVLILWSVGLTGMAPWVWESGRVW